LGRRRQLSYNGKQKINVTGKKISKSSLGALCPCPKPIFTLGSWAQHPQFLGQDPLFPGAAIAGGPQGARIWDSRSQRHGNSELTNFQLERPPCPGH